MSEIRILNVCHKKSILVDIYRQSLLSTFNSHYSFLPPSIIFGPYSFPKPPFLVYEVFYYLNLFQAYRKLNMGGD